MESRTFEGPMDWEYQDRGPFDPTSPFAQAAHNASRNTMFGSPFKSSRPNNPFANLSTPSRSQSQQQPPPQTSSFTPQVASKNIAPPFRNPAFTTPRRPVDEAVFSEASGAEDSPALTEASDYPNDTPEVDHRADVIMGGTVAPLKIDKASRYGKIGMSVKKHAPGKGEIRTQRDRSVGMRKRKRHNYDRDVGTVSYNPGQESDAWNSDSDTSVAPRNSKRSQQKDRDSDQQRGTVESFFHALNKYPNTPEHMQRWMQFGANLFLISTLLYVGWSVFSTVRNDIQRANASARLEFERGVADCRTQYQINECIRRDRPGLQALCDEWHECMYRDPESIIRVKVTVKQVAEIINEFTDAMNLKAWGIVLGFILICTTVNVGSLGRSNSRPHAEPTPPSHSHEAALDGARSPNITPGYMLVPVQTPKMRRRAMLDEGTDTDNSPLNLKPALTYQKTPSGRRSPSKGERGERQLSPIKYGRTPSRGGGY